MQCNLRNEINSGSNTFLLGFDMLVTYLLLRLENSILHKEYKMPPTYIRGEMRWCISRTLKVYGYENRSYVNKIPSHLLEEVSKDLH